MDQLLLYTRPRLEEVEEYSLLTLVEQKVIYLLLCLEFHHVLVLHYLILFSCFISREHIPELHEE